MKNYNFAYDVEDGLIDVGKQLSELVERIRIADKIIDDLTVENICLKSKLDEYEDSYDRETEDKT